MRFILKDVKRIEEGLHGEFKANLARRFFQIFYGGISMREEWNGFKAGRLWQDEVNVREFIQLNYTPYDGDSKFLAGPTKATQELFDELQRLQKAEHTKKCVGTDGKERSGVLDLDTDIVTGITSHKPGYIFADGSKKDLEQVVGLQTDKPLKRAFMPFGGIRMAEQSCEMYGYEPNKELHKIFTEYHKTHSDAVFQVYSPEIRKARSAHILTGLPDTYGRGRIVGDYRRIALYGIDFLIKEKQKDFANIGDGTMTDDVIRLREEVAEQIKCLGQMKEMAASYGFDISKNMVRLAGKRRCGASFFVANISSIPVKSGSVKLAFHLFAPFHAAEFGRILADDGVLITAVPGKNHLFGLKGVLYNTPYTNDEQPPEADGLTLIDTMRVKSKITLSSQQDINALFKMTPYYYHTPSGGMSRLEALDSLTTEIEFVLLIYKKR